VSFVIDGYETRLRDLIRQSDDLVHLENRISVILGQFLAQYGINVNRRNVDNSHQDQVNILPSSSGLSKPSLEVESTTQPAFDHLNGSDNDSWLQHDDFVISAENMYSDWAPDHDPSSIIGIEHDMFESWDLNHYNLNDMSIGNNVVDFAELEKGVPGSTFTSHSYEVLGGML
jgi:hypothetical protein